MPKYKPALKTYEVWNQKRLRWIPFTDCLDERDAKERFQWAYGYWPDLVREKVL